MLQFYNPEHTAGLLQQDEEVSDFRTVESLEEKQLCGRVFVCAVAAHNLRDLSPALSLFDETKKTALYCKNDMTKNCSGFETVCLSYRDLISDFATSFLVHSER